MAGRLKRILGRLVRWFLFLFAAQFLLGVGVFFWLTGTDGGRAVLLREAKAWLEAEVFQATFEAERLESVLGHLVLTNVQMWGADGRPLADARRLDVSYSLWPLLRRHVELSSIVVDARSADLVFAEDGSLNVATLIRPSETPSEPSPDSPGWSVEIATLDLRVDQARWLDHRNPSPELVRLQNVAGRARVSVNPDAEVSVMVRELRAQLMTPYELPIALARTSVEVRSDSIDGEAGSLKLGALQVDDAAWSLGLVGSGLTRVALSVPPTRVTEAALAPFLPEGLALAEPFDLSIEARGPARAIRLNLLAEQEEGSLAIRGSLDLSDPANPGIRAEMGLLRFVPSSWLVGAPDADLSLTLNASLRGTDLESLRGSVRLDAGPSRFEGIGLSGLYAGARLEDEGLLLDSLRLWQGSLELSLEGRVSRVGDLDLRLGFRAPDLAELDVSAGERLALGATGSADADLELQASLGFDPFELDNFPQTLEGWEPVFPTIRGEGELHTRRFRLGDIALTRGDLTLQATGDGQTARGRANLQLTGGDFAGLRVDRSTLALRLDGQRVTVTGDASLERGQVVVATDLVAERFDALEVTVRQLQGEAAGVDFALQAPTSLRVGFRDSSWEPLTLSLDTGWWRVLGTPLSLGGRFDLERQVVLATLAIPEIDLSNLAQVLPREARAEGNATVHLELDGPWRNPNARLSFNGQRVGAWGFAPHDVSLQGRLERGTLHANVDLERGGRMVATASTGGSGIPLEINLERGRVAISRTRPFSLEAAAERVSLADTLPPGLGGLESGTLMFDLGVAGSLDAPRATGSLSVDTGRIRIPLGDDEWVIDGFDLALLTQVDGTRSRWGIGGQGALSVGGRRLFRGDLRTEVDLDAFLADPMNALPNLAVNGVAALDELLITDLPQGLQRSLGLSEGRLSTALEWSGRVRDGSGRVDLELQGLKLQDMAPISVAGYALLGSQIEFLLAALYDSPTAPSVVPAEELVAPESGALMQLEGRLGAGIVAFLGEQIDASIPLEARLLLPRVGLSEFRTLVAGWTDETGDAAGYVDLWGTLGRPELRGRLASRGLSLTGGQRGSLALELTYLNKIGAFDVLLCDGEDEGVHLSGEVDVDLGLDALLAGLPPWSEWPFQARMEAEQVELARVVPNAVVAGLASDLSGSLNVDLDLSGTLGRPWIEGDLDLQQGMINLLLVNRTFNNLQTRLRFTPAAIRLEQFRVEDERGRLDGSGLVGLDGLGWVDASVELEARDFLITTSGGLGGFMSGTVSLLARNTSKEITADIELGALVVEIPDDANTGGAGPRELPSWVLIEGVDVDSSQRGRRNPAPLEVEETAPASPLRLVANVRSRDRGRLLLQFGEISFTVDLSAVLEGEDLSVSGAVGLPTGTIRVAGRDFTLSDRRILFPAGVEGVDPIVDIEAIYDLGPSVTEYLSQRGLVSSGDTATIRVVVRGATSDLLADLSSAVELVSDPRGLTEADLLQLLASGRLASDSDDSGGGQGANVLTALVLGLLGDQIRGGIPIDNIRIEASGEGQRVEGGKYISDSVYVSGAYIHSPGDLDDNNFEVALEWIIRRIGPGSLRLELRGGDRGKGGLELLYNLIRGR